MEEKSKDAKGSTENPIKILQTIIEEQRRESRDVKKLLVVNNKILVAFLKKQGIAMPAAGIAPRVSEKESDSSSGSKLSGWRNELSPHDYIQGALGPALSTVMYGGANVLADMSKFFGVTKLAKKAGGALKNKLFGPKPSLTTESAPETATGAAGSAGGMFGGSSKESQKYVKALRENSNVILENNKNSKDLIKSIRSLSNLLKGKRGSMGSGGYADADHGEQPKLFKKLLNVLTPKKSYTGKGPTEVSKGTGGLTPTIKPDGTPITPLEVEGGKDKKDCCSGLGPLIAAAVGSALTGLGGIISGAFKTALEALGLTSIFGSLKEILGGLLTRLVPLLGALTPVAIGAAIIAGVMAALNQLSKLPIIQAMAKEAEDRYKESPLYGSGQPTDGMTPAERGSQGRSKFRGEQNRYKNIAEEELREEAKAKNIDPNSISIKEINTRAAEIEKQVKEGKRAAPELPNPEEGRRKVEISPKKREEMNDAALRNSAQRELLEGGNLNPSEGEIRERAEQLKKKVEAGTMPQPQPQSPTLTGAARDAADSAQQMQEGLEQSVTGRSAPKSEPVQPPGDSTLTAADIVGNLVARAESGKAGYNAYNKGTAGKSGPPIDFSEMTIGEYLRRGDLPETDPDRVFAVGRYQIIPKTMREALKDKKIKELGINESTKLTPEVQDQLFQNFLIQDKRPDVEKFLSGDPSVSVDDAVLAMSKEFASIGVPYDTTRVVKDKNGNVIKTVPIKKGQSFYSGVGGNAAHIKPEEMKEALLAAREARKTEPAGGATMIAGRKPGEAVAGTASPAPISGTKTSTSVSPQAAIAPPIASAVGSENPVTSMQSTLSGAGVGPQEASSAPGAALTNVPGFGQLAQLGTKITSDLPKAALDLFNSMPKEIANDPAKLKEYLDINGPKIMERVMGGSFGSMFKPSAAATPMSVAENYPNVALSPSSATPFQAKDSQSRSNQGQYLNQGSMNRDMLKDNAAIQMARAASAPPIISTNTNNFGSGAQGQLASLGLPTAEPRASSPFERYQDRVTSFVS